MNSPYNGKFKVTQEFKGKTHDGLDIVGLDGKEIYSTIDGTVEKADWENKKNKKQGFGLYVRIKKAGSKDKYYFGHMSKVKVFKGQKVKKGDLLGIEGNTGYSFGTHCHYCVREKGLKSKFKDICEISGIPNKLGTYESVIEKPKEENLIKTKTITQIAKEVINGKWGNGADRKKKLKAAGYSYSEVQKRVNQILKGKK